MAITGSVTSAVSSTSVTLPESNMTIVAVSVYTSTATGYLSIPVDPTRNALLPFKSPVLSDVAATPTDAYTANPDRLMWRVHFRTSGSTLNYTGTGLTGGTFNFYYGSALPGSLPLETFTAITVSYTTGTSLAFTFPAGPIRLTGIINVTGTSSGQTNLHVTDTFNTASGRTILVNFRANAVAEIFPIELIAAQTLTVTQAYDGTHVGTGYLLIYYSLR